MSEQKTITNVKDLRKLFREHSVIVVYCGMFDAYLRVVKSDALPKLEREFVNDSFALTACVHEDGSVQLEKEG